MNKFSNIKTSVGKKGFTVLYAVLTASLLLSIGASIYGTSIKDLVLTGSASDSQRAIYAADSAFECAWYWDSIAGGGSNAFASSTVAGGSTIVCAGQTIVLDNGDECSVDIPGIGVSYINSCEFNFDIGTGDLCTSATVNVTQYVTTAGQDRAVFRLDGFSSCDPTERRVQRTVEISY